WVDPALLLSISSALSPWLRDEVPILDEARSRQLRDGLASVPWVREASIERVFPDRFKLHLDLRRPVLAVRDAEGAPLCLVDRDAVALPWVDTPLPVTVLHREGGAPSMAVELGQPVAEGRVRAAAGIAVEWRDELLPLVPECPALLEVDATNLGERWLRGPSYPEVRVKLRRSDGAGVVFAYGRPLDSPMPRVPVRTKATVLGQILRQHPGLQGLVAGDLRLSRRWADYLQPRASGVRDPNGPWSELFAPRDR
ncbi:MAG: FtsQ-type POTRA domain-containing protein, partial [Planctomycetota bacterium]